MPQLEDATDPEQEQEDTDHDKNGVEEATALLKSCEAAAETRWAALSDADLDNEIAAFRKGIRDVSNELQSLGVAVSIEEAQAEVPAGPEDAEVGCPCLAALGVQGADTLWCRALHLSATRHTELEQPRCESSSAGLFHARGRWHRYLKRMA